MEYEYFKEQAKKLKGRKVYLFSKYHPFKPGWWHGELIEKEKCFIFVPIIFNNFIVEKEGVYLINKKDNIRYKINYEYEINSNSILEKDKTKILKAMKTYELIYNFPISIKNAIHYLFEKIFEFISINCDVWDRYKMIKNLFNKEAKRIGEISENNKYITIYKEYFYFRDILICEREKHYIIEGRTYGNNYGSDPDTDPFYYFKSDPVITPNYLASQKSPYIDYTEIHNEVIYDKELYNWLFPGHPDIYVDMVKDEIYQKNKDNFDWIYNNIEKIWDLYVNNKLLYFDGKYTFDTTKLDNNFIIEKAKEFLNKEV